MLSTIQHVALAALDPQGGPEWALALAMSEDNQIVTPPSFIALFVPPGRIKPTASREFIAQRYELCEDMATMLTEPAQMRLWELGITEADVLQRMHQGLLVEPTQVTADEAAWVTRRLAELLNWDCPPWVAPVRD
jgi:hypothetical protein